MENTLFGKLMVYFNDGCYQSMNITKDAYTQMSTAINGIKTKGAKGTSQLDRNFQSICDDLGGIRWKFVKY